MGFIIGILKRIIKFFLYIALVIAIILLIPNLPPYTKFTSIDLDPTQPRTGALAPNGDLNNVEKLYIDKVAGPEAFQLWNGEVYTSLATGELVKISLGGHVTFVTQIGQPCTGIVHEHICGRPLGFVIDDKNKKLYVADSYLGIWSVDLKSYKKQLLVSPSVAIKGRKPMLFNSVALANNGDLYWTDSTSDYHLKDGAFAIISDPAGRLFRYNPATNDSTVLLDDLWFANGLIISPDNSFILVVETNRLRVLKHYIDGPKKGSTEVFVSGLPGTPDTIRVLPDGSGVLVALYAAFDDEHPLLLKSLAPTPLARKAAARFMRLLELPFEFLNTHFPHIIFEEIVYTIGHFATLSGFGPGLSGLVQVDWNGNIVASYYNTDNSVNHISDAIVFNDKLYLGCPHKQNYIASVPAPPLLKKAFNVAKPSPSPTKPILEEQIPKKDKVKEEGKDNRKIEKPVEKRPSQKIDTEKPSSGGDKIKIDSQKQSEIKSNTIPKDPVKQAIKEDTIKTIPKGTETKPKEAETKPKEAETKPKEAETKPIKGTVPEPSKPKTTAPSKPIPKAESKKEVPSDSKVVPESKPNVVHKVETKKESPPEPKVVPETKPKAAPKVELKKDAPIKTETVKSDKVAESKISGNDKNTPNVDTIKSTTKPEKVKSTKKPKKNQEEEPRIIVQKVVPDEIPIVEEIPSDTVKPKDESLKVIKRSGPIEIPVPSV